jgi:two-component system, response regulator
MVVRDGSEAMDLLCGESASLVPSLILLDLKLPKVSGLEVLGALRHEHRLKFTPVVVFSSSTESCDIARSYARGANCYVSKPVDFESFLDAVATTVRYWLRIVSIPD